MNKLFVLAIALVAVGVLVGMGVLQTAPTPASFRVWEHSGTPVSYLEVGGSGSDVTANADDFTASADRATGVSVLLSGSGTSSISWFVNCAGTYSPVVAGVASVSLTSSPTWRTLGEQGGRAVVAGNSCNVKLIASGGEVRWWNTSPILDATQYALVVWGENADGTGPAPGPDGPGDGDGDGGVDCEATPEAAECAPPPGETGTDPTFLLVAVALVVGGFALILIRR